MWSPPQEILPGVFLGDWSDATDVEKLKRLDIGAVLNVADFTGETLRLYDKYLPDIKYGGLPIEDCPSFPIERFLMHTNRFIHTAVRDGRRILVHCQAGISRSVAVLIAYMVCVRGWHVGLALRHIQSLRPQAGPNLGFMRALDRLECRLARYF
jgi:protein-tyrosine phosphatase